MSTPNKQSKEKKQINVKKRLNERFGNIDKKRRARKGQSKPGIHPSRNVKSVDIFENEHYQKLKSEPSIISQKHQQNNKIFQNKGYFSKQQNHQTIKNSTF